MSKWTITTKFCRPTVFAPTFRSLRLTGSFAFVCSMSIIASCHLCRDPTGTDYDFDTPKLMVTPPAGAILCPGDSVELKWNLDIPSGETQCDCDEDVCDLGTCSVTSDCPEGLLCIDDACRSIEPGSEFCCPPSASMSCKANFEFSISGENGTPIDPPIGPTEESGSRDITATQDDCFTLEGSFLWEADRCGEVVTQRFELTSEEYCFDVVDFPGDNGIITIQGNCMGDYPPITLAVSKFARLRRIRNLSGFAITLNGQVIAAGGETEAFNYPGTPDTWAASANVPVIIPPNCDDSPDTHTVDPSSLPPPIRLALEYECVIEE